MAVGKEHTGVETMVAPRSGALSLSIDADVSLMTPNELRENIKVLSAQIDAALMHWGAMLYRVWHEKLYVDYLDEKGHAFKAFDEYVENDLNDVGERKAKYLLSIYRYFNERIKDTELFDEVKVMGWTRLKELIGIINRKNKDRFLKLAKENSAFEFTRIVRSIKKGIEIDEATGEIRTKSGEDFSDVVDKSVETVKKEHMMTFAFYDEQYENVKNALEIAEKLASCRIPSNNISYICLEFLANNSDLAKKTLSSDEALKVYLGRLEKELKIEIICMKGDKVIYREDSLKRLNP